MVIRRKHYITKAMNISIVIPIYNVEKYILNCLKSVVNQTHHIHKIECILVNDCSKDDSINIAKNFIDSTTSEVVFRIIEHKQNRGLSAARNTGLSNSTGDYVLFLDSDDMLCENAIFNLTQPLSEHLYDFIIGDVKVTGGANNKSPKLCLEEGAYVGNLSIRNTYLNHQWYMMAWNKLCKSDFLKSNNLYFKEGLIHEDDMWSFQLSLCANSFYVVREQTYNYLIRSGSITTEKNQVSHIEAYLTIANEITQYIAKYQLPDCYIQFCHEYILGTYVYLRHLNFKQGLNYFKKIANNQLYKSYYSKLLQLESFKETIKIRISRMPSWFGYLMLRISFLVADVRKK